MKLREHTPYEPSAARTFSALLNSSLLNCSAALAVVLVLAGRLGALATEPLDQWSWRNPLPNGDGLDAITYANGRFAAVGGGMASTSLDGTDWQSRVIGPIFGAATNYYFGGLAWGGGVWVAVGTTTGLSSGFILSSPDLTTWTADAAPEHVWSLGGVAYGSGQFVAVGSAFINQSLTYACLTSPDGLHWTRQPPITGDAELTAISYGNGVFVAEAWNNGAPASILTSPDGTNWTVSEDGSGVVEPANFAPYGLAYGNGTFLTFVGLGYPEGGGVLTSADGLTWTRRGTMPPVASRQAHLAYGGGLFLAPGPNGLIETSPDGTKWTEHASGTTSRIGSVAYGNGTFVAGGPAALVVSTNGVSWRSLVSSVTTAPLLDVAYGQGEFVALDSDGVVLCSTNGAQWGLAGQAIAAADPESRLGYGGATFVMAGDHGTMLASADGVDWTVATNADVGPPGSLLYDVAYGSGQFVAVGSSGLVLTSTNGLAWTARDSWLGFDLQAVTYGDGLFVAGGSDIATSPDGAAWTDHYLGLPGKGILALGYGGGTFVAAGAGGLIMSSTNGTDWATNSSGTVADLYRVAYGDGTFLVSGYDGTLLTSTNGQDWVSRDSGTMIGLEGAAFGQDTFVVVGGNGAILQSGALPSPAVRLRPVPGWRGGGFGLSLSGPAGGHWELQGSTDLRNWTALGTVSLTNGQAPFVDSSATNFTRRFYRAVSR